MGTVLSALAVVCVLAASGALLVHLAVSESRRSARPRTRLDGPPPAQTAGAAAAPAAAPQVAPAVQAVPPAPAQPALARAPAPAPLPAPAPAARAVPVQAAGPLLSPDGLWLWTGAGWVPAWRFPPPPPPPPSGLPYPRPARSHGCAAAFGVGCLLLIGILALVAFIVVTTASALAAWLTTALGA